MNGKSIFLTGASGNVGRTVLQELLGRGHEVLVLVRTTLPDVKGYRPIFGNLQDIRQVAAEIASTDGVIHCASPRTHDRSAVLREDIEGTARLLDTWISGPFIYMSSQTVYGIPTRNLSENIPLNPCTWYDLGKVCNEFQLQMESSRQARGPAISLRLPLVFASGPRRRDRQFLPSIYDAVLAKRPFLFSDAEAVENCGSVYIGGEDLGRAVVDSLGIIEPGNYNLAGGFCTWKELLEKMAWLLGTRLEITIRAGAIAKDNEFRLPQSRSFYDCSRFVHATGFQSRQSLDEIIGRFVSSEAV